METFFSTKSLCHFHVMPDEKDRRCSTKNFLSFLGERGDSLLAFILIITSSMALFGSLYFLNKYFENKTKEHLYDFKKKWDHLETRYQR